MVPLFCVWMICHLLFSCTVIPHRRTCGIALGRCLNCTRRGSCPIYKNQHLKNRSKKCSIAGIVVLRFTGKINNRTKKTFAIVKVKYSFSIQQVSCLIAQNRSMSCRSFSCRLPKPPQKKLQFTRITETSDRCKYLSAFKKKKTLRINL